MAAKPLPSYGEKWAATVSNLATAYGRDKDQMAVAVYAIAEQLHQHYCLSRGIVNHQESRPDQDVAVSLLGSLAATDWWLVRSMELRPAMDSMGELPEAGIFDDPAES